MTPNTRFLMQSHRKVIAYIHLVAFRVEKPTRFSVKIIEEGSGVSNSSVTRTLRKLVDLKLLRHYDSGFAQRHYQTTNAWPKDVMKVIETYELAKVLKL